MSPEFESLTIEITLSANRDFLGSLTVWSDAGEIAAGPFPVAGRASDDIAAEHGNPMRAPTLPYGDPPAGTFRYGGQKNTGAGSRLRQDLFGPKPVIVLLPTGGPAALGDANGRFEIFIHGGPPATSGGLRATSGHFRISDPDLELLGAIVERAGRVSCVCVETAIPGPGLVAGLGPPRQATINPDRTGRTPRPLVPYEALVAFGEYTSPDPTPPDPSTERSLNSPALAPGGQQGAAQFGMVNICQRMQDSANLAACTDTNAYTGGVASTSAAADNPFTSWQTSYYPGGQSPFYPDGQNVNSYNGPPGPAPNAGPSIQPGSASLPGAPAPGAAPGSVAASLPFMSLTSPGLTSPGTASPFGDNANPFMPGSVPVNAIAASSTPAVSGAAEAQQAKASWLNLSAGSSVKVGMKDFSGLSTSVKGNLGVSVVNLSGHLGSEQKSMTYNLDPDSLTTGSGSWTTQTIGDYRLGVLGAGWNESGPTLSLVDLELRGVTVTTGGVMGNWIAGATIESKSIAGEGKVEVGFKEGTFKVGAGVTVASERLSVGGNLLGLNIGIFGEINVGLKVGVDLGEETSLSAGLFSAGITVGAAKTSESRWGYAAMLEDLGNLARSNFFSNPFYIGPSPFFGGP
jgi:hypothetical protein